MVDLGLVAGVESCGVAGVAPGVQGAPGRANSKFPGRTYQALLRCIPGYIKLWCTGPSQYTTLRNGLMHFLSLSLGAELFLFLWC